MNLKHLALPLLAAAAFATPALRADTRFSIGIHVGVPVAPPAVVVHSPPAVVVHAPPPVAVYAPAPGYWKEVVVKTWIPERWTHSRDRWGRPVRVCEPGHYTYRTERVWVETHRPGHPHSYPGYGPGYAYRGR
jgi:hypothetical protein